MCAYIRVAIGGVSRASFRFFLLLCVNACNIAVAPSCYVLTLFFSNSIRHQLLVTTYDTLLLCLFIMLFAIYSLLTSNALLAEKFKPSRNALGICVFWYFTHRKWHVIVYRIRIQWIPTLHIRPSKQRCLRGKNNRDNAHSHAFLFKGLFTFQLYVELHFKRKQYEEE